jgi:hypothetical protein
MSYYEPIMVRIYGVMVRVFNATFNNISVRSWLSVLLVEETGATAGKTTDTYCCIEYISPSTAFTLKTLMVIRTDYTGSCISN